MYTLTPRPDAFENSAPKKNLIGFAGCLGSLLPHATATPPSANAGRHLAENPDRGFCFRWCPLLRDAFDHDVAARPPPDRGCPGPRAANCNAKWSRGRSSVAKRRPCRASRLRPCAPVPAKNHRLNRDGFRRFLGTPGIAMVGFDAARGISQFPACSRAGGRRLFIFPLQVPADAENRHNPACRRQAFPAAATAPTSSPTNVPRRKGPSCPLRCGFGLEAV